MFQISSTMSLKKHLHILNQHFVPFYIHGLSRLMTYNDCKITFIFPNLCINIVPSVSFVPTLNIAPTRILTLNSSRTWSHQSYPIPPIQALYGVRSSVLIPIHSPNSYLLSQSLLSENLNKAQLTSRLCIRGEETSSAC